MVDTSADRALVLRLGEPKDASGTEVRFQCPCAQCVGRDDYKLYVNFAKRVFHCIRSDWGGGLYKLYQFLGLTVERPAAPSDQELAELVGESSGETAVEVGTVVTLPPTNDQWEYSDHEEWLQGRLKTIPAWEIEDLKSRGVVRRGVGKYWHRVFFVDTYAGQVRYWAARTIYPDFEPKYLNPKAPRTHVLGNQERVEEERQDEIIICEGVISAIVAGPNAVWTLGRCVSSTQIDLLDSLTCSRFVVAAEPDRAAQRNALDLARLLHARHREVYIVDCPPGTDPADLGRETFQKLVQESAVRYSWSAEVLRRLND